MACFIVFGLRPQKTIDLKPFLPPETATYLVDYTPYYPGQKDLYKHEIFAPYNQHKKKLVILGSSTADSIGCDYTWQRPDDHKNPQRNVHFTCSITNYLNVALRDNGLDEWQAFNLACDASRQANMLFTYARIAELKPDLVVFIDSFPFAETRNAGVTYLDASQYAYLSHVYSENPHVAAEWQSYNDFLIRRGDATAYRVPVENPAPDFRQKTAAVDHISLNDILVVGIGRLRNLFMIPVRPLPVALNPMRRVWAEIGDTDQEETDPDLQYLQAFNIIRDMQAAHGGQFVMVLAPIYDQRHHQSFLESIHEGRYGQYFRDNRLNVLDLVQLPLRPVYETYDGYHQTPAGNARIANEIFNYLQKQRFLPIPPNTSQQKTRDATNNPVHHVF